VINIHVPIRIDSLGEYSIMPSQHVRIAAVDEARLAVDVGGLKYAGCYENYLCETGPTGKDENAVLEKQGLNIQILNIDITKQ